ncbi:MAG TPA: hypothetical protein VMT75_11890 [Candidatus Saccharimonadales bacterium]|nr:hypothetical protein [Candidatus Saccharimonadales bacterium]
MRRWEVERGLPVHRVPGAGRGSVFAYREELDRWLEGAGKASGDSGPVAAIEPEPVKPEGDGERVAPAPSPAPVLVPAAKPASSSPTGRNPLLWSLPIVVLAAFLIVIVYRNRGARFQTLAATPGKRPVASLQVVSQSVAVLPFVNGRGAGNDYLSDGVTESLIGNLAHLPQVKVRSRDSVFRYKGKDVEVRTIGKELGVSVVVTGRVTTRGDNVDISAELTDVRDNTEIWGNHYSGKTANLIALQQQMSGDIAQRLRATLSSAEKQRVIDQGTDDPEAYSLYLKGRYAFYTRSYGQLPVAISLFNQAIAKDKEYALAYSGLADVYSVRPEFGGNPSEDYPKSNAAARKALELDPTLAHPHAVLGSNEMGYDWDFAGGEAEFKKAIELDANDATAHQWYAERLAAIGGREKEAWAEINVAHQLDPQAPVIRRVMGSVLVMGRRFDDAIAVCKQLESEEPAFTLAHDCLGYAYWGKRMYPEVVEEWKMYGQLSGNREEAEWSAALERGFQAGGWNGSLTEAIRILEAQRKTGYTSPYKIARLYADLGDKEKALEWLETAYREHDWLLMELNTGFQFDGMRRDARFQELVKKVGLAGNR